MNILSLVDRINKYWPSIRLPRTNTSQNVSGAFSKSNYLDMVAIENSANCNLRCEACPTSYAKNYPGKFMEMDTFKRICSNITPDIVPKCGLIGWGEPFLDPQFFEKLRYLKRRNYYVGSTTNLTLFNEKVANTIMDSGMDHLNISMDANHFNASRITLPEMTGKIDTLFKLRDTNSASLAVGVVIVAFKSSYDLVCKILQALKDYPFTHMDIIPPWYLPSKDLYAEAMSKKELLSFKKRIMEEFTTLKINFDFSVLKNTYLANCRANIFKTAYVNYRGEVSPCAALAMEFPNITFSGKAGWFQPLSFGRLDQSGFEEIWDTKNYRYFRSQFRQNKLPQQCIYCNLWRKLLEKSDLHNTRKISHKHL